MSEASLIVILVLAFVAVASVAYLIGKMMGYVEASKDISKKNDEIIKTIRMFQ